MSYPHRMRETLAALLMLAVIGSVVGAWGLVRYDTADVDEALAALPSVPLGAAVVDLFGVAVSVAVALPRIVSDEEETEEQRRARQSIEAQRAEAAVERQRHMQAGYAEFRDRRWSAEVHQHIDSICPAPDASDSSACVERTRDALVALRAERLQTRQWFEDIAYAAGGLWLAAAALFSWRRFLRRS